MNIISPLIIGIIIGHLLPKIIIRNSQWSQLIDRPNSRSSHSVATPRGGGIGILVSILVCVTIYKASLILAIAALVIGMLGLADDFFHLSVISRLLVQSLFAFIVSYWIYANHYGSAYPLLWLILSSTLIIGYTNHYNFMDGINGIVALSSIISFLIFGVIALQKGIGPISLVPFSCAGACLGFLPMNFPKAKIFLGDVGSSLLGFLLAVYILILASSFKEMILYLGFSLPFIADESSTLISRIRNKENLTIAHRRHVYQIMANQMGLSHLKVTLIYAGIQVVAAVTLISLFKLPLVSFVVSATTIFALLFSIALFIRGKWERTSPAFE